jgi:hypothetical protein
MGPFPTERAAQLTRHRELIAESDACAGKVRALSAQIAQEVGKSPVNHAKLDELISQQQVAGREWDTVLWQIRSLRDAG